MANLAKINFIHIYYNVVASVKLKNYCLIRNKNKT